MKRRRGRRAAGEAGRTYEEQFAFEQANGAAPQDDRVATGGRFRGFRLATPAEAAAALGLSAAEAAALAKTAGQPGAGAAAGGAAPAAGGGGADCRTRARRAGRAWRWGGRGGAGGRPGSAGCQSGCHRRRPRRRRKRRPHTARVRGARRRHRDREGAARCRRRREPGHRVRLDAAARGHQQPELPARCAVCSSKAPNPNIANKGGWTPLYLATDNRNIEGGDYPVPKPDMDHLEFIKLLLTKGADPNCRSRKTR